MSPIRYYFVIVVTLCLLYSCNRQEKQHNKRILMHVEGIIESSPHNALSMLDSLNTKLMNEQQYSYYVALRIRAKDRVGMNISRDTVIIQAKNYLEKKKDVPRAALAGFVSGRVTESQGNTTKAIQTYQNAADWAVRTSNHLLSGHINYAIGRLLYIQGLHQESIPYLKTAYTYYNIDNCDYKYKLYGLELIAADFLLLPQLDSALYYFDLAMVLANKEKDTYNQQRILQYTASALLEAKQYVIAKEKCLQAIELTEQGDSLNQGKLRLLYARILSRLGNNDITATYLSEAEKLLINSDATFDLSLLYQLFASLEQEKGNFEKAFQYKELQLAYIQALYAENEAVSEEQKRYQDTTFQSAQEERDKQSRQLRTLYIIIAFLGLVLTIFVISYLYYRYQKQTSKKEADFEEKINELKKAFSEEQIKLVFQINNAANLEDVLHAKDINANYGKAQALAKNLFKITNWDNVYAGLSKAHDGLAAHLKADFPQLSEKEYRICLLSCAGYSVLGVSKILNYAQSSIQSWQSKIRKEIGIAPTGSFVEFVYSKYGITIIEKTTADNN